MDSAAFLVVLTCYVGAALADGSRHLCTFQEQEHEKPVQNLMLYSYLTGHSYAHTCPKAEWIIRETMKKHRNLAAGVLRMHFHDCFVDGCDGSVLLESSPTDGSQVERQAIPNQCSLKGFEVIQEAKHTLEAVCPGTVSCADILAIAARDATVLLGGIDYKVPTGRYDGRSSKKQTAEADLPSPNSTLDKLLKAFDKKDLSAKDLVLLSGAHTIGVSKCSNFDSRLYNFNSSSGKSDPAFSGEFLEQLKKKCPKGAKPSPSVGLDDGSSLQFDNSYFQNVINNRGLLISDHALLADPRTNHFVKYFAQNPTEFLREFALSMIRMGNVAWKTKRNGEIRRHCFQVNPSAAQ